LVQLKALKNNPKDRKIREVIRTGADVIRVYEPAADDIDKLIEIAGLLSENTRKTGMIQLSDTTMLREVIPMLTDITGLEEMTDDEIHDVIENPSVELMQVSKLIESILVGVYKTVILSYKVKLEQQDFELSAEMMGTQSLSTLDKVASLDPDSQAAMYDLQKAKEQLEEAKVAEGTEAADEAIVTESLDLVEAQAQLEEKSKQAIDYAERAHGGDVEKYMQNFKSSEE
jgi:hypothetical protein